MIKTTLKPAVILLMLFSTSCMVAGTVTISGDPVRYINPIFEKVEIEKDILFGEVINFDGKTEKLLLGVYTPDGDIQRGRPVILWIHGGGFRYGNDKSQSYIVKMATEFAKRGYVCVSINYRVRNNPKDDKLGTMANALEDAMSALNWLRNNKTKLKISVILGGR